MAKRLRVIRADNSDDDGDLGVVQASHSRLSNDGRRIIRSAVTACARVDGTFLGPGELQNLPAQYSPAPIPIHVLIKKQVRRYRNLDQNMLVWMEEKRAQEFLREFVRLEGRGRKPPKFCESCFDGLRLMVPGEPLYRCQDCWGTRLECLQCILTNHARLPFHRILRWNGVFFEAVTLSSLGLRLQLGHEDGRACVNPQAACNDFTILHDNGIHKVSADFCGCEQRVSEKVQMLRSEVYPSTIRNPKTGITLRLLETFDKISSSGKISIYEHYQGLERLTDNTRINLPKSRYRSYLRVNRQYAHIIMLKRAGRGSVKDGIATTQPGGLALRCPACPREGVNLPENWESLPEEIQFLYRLLLAMDANFRLKNLRRPGTHDPGLHTGLAYFVENLEYLAISSCAGFKTLAHAETKNSAGLQSTGVGMCLCARHEIVRPNGIGDLQKGERYCNMDYIALSGVRDVKKLAFFWSYDIACQWSIHLFDRMKELPVHLQLDPTCKISFGVPKCHCRGHKLACQVNYSMNVQPGVGQSCGESPERVWHMLNASASSTKEMLPGGRRDILDRRIGSHNWDKVTRIARHIHKKLYDTYAELSTHQLSHDQFTAILPESDVAGWLSEVLKWEGDKSQKNPYFRAQSHKSELSVRQALAEEERKAARDTPPLHETSATVMLSMAFIIEDLSRAVQQLLKGEEKDAPASVQEVYEKRCQIQTYIRHLRELQAVYMSCVAGKLANAAGSRTGDVEEERLWLPSELEAEERKEGCAKGLGEAEDVLRYAQCLDALDTIRRMQAAKCTIIAFRKINVRGQRSTGRIHSIVKRLEAKSSLAVAKYRAARAALTELRGPGEWEKLLKPLVDADIKALDGMSFDTELPRGNKKRKVSRNPQLGSGSQTISWIWLMEGAVEGEDIEQVDGTVRVEWLKSRARVNRRREEVMLLGAEKERVLLSFEYEACQWEERVVPWEGLDEADVTLENLNVNSLAQRLLELYIGRASLFVRG